ncbi:Lar family restriction alleviation protein [Stenotrophomonas maltophilia]|uniref:Lar family restriction alleviation protein n=1 Tax=Stenotrophomonas maltophilia TaxID=40324 RepID=UPI001310C425|nr:Lar family restriction alleviation protein [Stenotrophomonas maltophilia]MCU1040939.1 Lar family restriction alleviation protein [Stenotrophomonas maltophilia]HDS0944971.1 Lar family restriction alleviation protein [Stenotrophomonas maltophilia]HDS0952621.1 Lar family restriction alleviation protein [Stenotrophomonas maltophilia]HDS1000772.1 Lar family restriction alleviation protein [Stenotrophomonas maltophilia]HEC1325254.1 Lar family restriction alleviation protein [Stenotrophomonas malt
MSNDIKTLADVQPGGRVRLGDHPLPCPFCGGQATMETTTEPDESCHCVRCVECDFDLMGGPIGIGWWPTPAAAISAWNRRTLSVPAVIQDTPEVRDILGRPNFWCSPWANVLRRRGDVIPCNAEEEQAAVIRFMLNHYLAHGAGWAEAAEAELQAIRYQVTRND